MTARRCAVVLFNLGGPDSLAAVRPFLFNLFNDPAIIRLPQPLRWLIAQIIVRARAKTAQEIYRKLGGASPLLAGTQAQAAALEARLNGTADGETRVVVAMRYWQPLTEAAVDAVRRFAPDEIVLLPLYPQYSTTTTASSLAAWRRCATAMGLTAPSFAVRSYPDLSGFVAAQADLLKRQLTLAARAPVRVLFSAHGLPQKIVDAGDPYPLEVALSAKSIAEAAGLSVTEWRVCYQSRVGPMKWLAPSIDEELQRAAQDKVGVVVVPIAFVSEHSETLVELDIDYRHHAAERGVVPYLRAATVGTHPAFIDGLAELVGRARSERRQA